MERTSEWQLVSDESIVRPNEATKNDLLIAHSRLDDERVFILDVYNPRIYPFDHKAQEGISRSVHVGSMTSEREYLRLLKKHLTSSLAEFKCDLVVYNAGTDGLEGDPLGRLNLSPENETPIVMVTSGGYLMESADVIATSIRNLHEKELIQLKA
ncbi:unnamed protein product [Heligmosomoides polygyrus]|uniref:Hist_deacetyl domain-containing protein n=1 Tax=Heligmosomoides polygyrus TaxID=6339 RepID=A0A183G9Q6_HELPZ|nr:unnamed protein product [Heligmosomoides polygyrus]